MAVAHNMFIRGLNSVYLQAPLIHEPKDAADLFIFCKAWIIAIKHHHDVEEAALFTDLEKFTHDAKILARERDQHRQIHEGLSRFKQYITETQPEAYRWKDFESVLESFSGVLKMHLTEEIEALLKLRDTEVTDEELKLAWKHTEEEAKDFKEPDIMVYQSIVRSIRLLMF
jgi:hemerythrin-like domain-containing protein